MIANTNAAVLLTSLAILAGLLTSLAAPQDPEQIFVDQLYPLFRQVQCHLCHNDNGVASGYGIEFPSGRASREQILAFGYQLVDYVDKEQPAESPLWLKPTGRSEHTGGVRIAPGSAAAAQLKQWVDHLAQLTPEQQTRVAELIKQTNQWKGEPTTLRRLTHSQYDHTVRDLLGDESEPANQFPKEDFIHGFKNQVEAQGVSPLLAEAYSQAAERLARNAFRGGDQKNLIPRKPTAKDDPQAAEEFVASFGFKAFRRPLTKSELDKYTRLLLTASTSSELPLETAFQSGASLVIEAMLQSPSFLYRRDVGISTDKQASQRDRQQQFAAASRLAYVLWDTMPDEALLQVAQAGQLTTREQIESQIRRLLSDARSDQALHEFLSQWLRFDRVLSATRDRRRYREFNPELAASMVEETQRLFDHLVKNDRNFMELFTADYTFINANLARVYNLPEPAGEFEQVRYPTDSGRSGILGHGTFLVSTSKPAETSPTARGLFIRNQLLAQEIAPPPPGVNAVLPEILEDQPLTNRERLQVHLNSEACASCHRLIDPIGYAFEQYDAIGAFHEKVQFRFGTRENPVMKELPVDTAAFIGGMADSQFSRPKELGKLLAESEIAQRCIVKQYFRYVMGREETAADTPVIDSVFHTFQDSGFKFREMIVALFLETTFKS